MRDGHLENDRYLERDDVGWSSRGCGTGRPGADISLRDAERAADAERHSGRGRELADVSTSARIAASNTWSDPVNGALPFSFGSRGGLTDPSGAEHTTTRWRPMDEARRRERARLL
jgi:hypothetical protein